MVSARGCGKQTVVLGWLGVGVLLAACQTTGLNPTGLHGTEVRCSEGPRQTLDCRGAIQQYARDLKADVSVAKQVTLGLGVVSTKLIEADAITSDLVQHYYQTCSLYNACLITRQEYVAKTERLQEIQLSVRQALAAAGFGAQQNIQINPLGGGPPGAGVPGAGVPGGAFPGSPFPGGGGVPRVGQAPPGPATPGVQGDPSQQQRTAVAAPGSPPADTVDAILGVLREGSKLLRQPGAGPAGAAANPVALNPTAQGAAPGAGAGSPPPLGAPRLAPAPAVPSRAQGAVAVQALEGSLRRMLVSLKQDVVQQDPSLGAAR